jgi:hypothetical protein
MDPKEHDFKNKRNKQMTLRVKACGQLLGELSAKLCPPLTL